MNAGEPAPRFATVVLDVDSTLAGVEGIDWLAGLRDEGTAAFVHALTEDAMNGRIALEDAYARRLERIAPTLSEVWALAGVYHERAAAGAAAAIATMQRAGVRVIAMSGGLRAAILPLCLSLAIDDRDVYGVEANWDDDGKFTGFNHASVLATQAGKALLLQTLLARRPILAVGDGSTDLVMRTSGAADVFAAFTGFVRRAPVVAAADHAIASFAELIALVLPDQSNPQTS